MAFTRPTLQEITDQILADLSSEALDEGKLFKFSPLRILGKVLAGAIHLLYGFLEWVAKQLFVTTADKEYLDLHAAEYGLTRKAATKASGTGSVSGVDGTIIPAGTELLSPAENTYIVSSQAIIVDGSAVGSFTAKEAGETGNDDPDIELIFLSPVPGVSSSLTVDSAGISNGYEEENDDLFRDRILARKRQPPHGGAAFDYENWTLEVSGVTNAWIFPNYMGAGTVGVAFIVDNDDLIPDEAKKLEVKEYLRYHIDPVIGADVGAPIGVDEYGIFIIDLIKKEVDFSISLYPNTAAVQATVMKNIKTLLLEKGGPGGLLYLSDIDEQIKAAAGEERHKILFPVDDISVSQNEISIPNTTWSEY
ncbi:MAG: baseplate J/gp47 family protein [bacterium]|nr:baseplate J/gp47 family protein [bacterium]